jgi:hypothetical protein
MEVVNISYQISNLTVVLSSKLTVCAKKAAGMKIRKKYHTNTTKSGSYLQ